MLVKAVAAVSLSRKFVLVITNRSLPTFPRGSLTVINMAVSLAFGSCFDAIQLIQTDRDQKARV